MGRGLTRRRFLQIQSEAFLVAIVRFEVVVAFISSGLATCNLHHPTTRISSEPLLQFDHLRAEIA